MSVAKKSAFLKTFVEFQGSESIPVPETVCFVQGFFPPSALTYNFSFLFLPSGSFVSCGWSWCLWSLVEPSKVGAGA